jgi:hypothetical protein
MTLDEASLAGRLCFWQDRLGGRLPVLDLRLDRRRSTTVAGLAATSRPVAIDAALGAELATLAAEHGVSASTVLLAVFGTAVLAGGVGLYGALGIHVFFAGLLDIRGWRRRLVRILRFFSWRRAE